MAPESCFRQPRAAEHPGQGLLASLAHSVGANGDGATCTSRRAGRRRRQAGRPWPMQSHCPTWAFSPPSCSLRAIYVTTARLDCTKRGWRERETVHNDCARTATRPSIAQVGIHRWAQQEEARLELRGGRRGLVGTATGPCLTRSSRYHFMQEQRKACAARQAFALLTGAPTHRPPPSPTPLKSDEGWLRSRHVLALALQPGGRTTRQQR